jgi:membrane-bound lytic murein transglycosylase D
VVGYFKELYQQFDDWLLVVAAYNCGSGKVYKAIKLSGSHDFWKLQRYLPAETKAHVKHFIATHYYYEQSGSIVTLTKKERLNYLASVAEIEAKSKETKMDGHTDSANQPSNVSLVNQQDSAMIVEWRK